MRSKRQKCRLIPATYPVKIIKGRALHLQGPSGDVISKVSLNRSVKTQKERACHAKKSHVQCFVINADSHIAVLDELMDG